MNSNHHNEALRLVARRETIPNEPPASGAGVSPAAPGVSPALADSRARRPGGRRDARPTTFLAGLCCLLLVAIALAGCVSKSTADAQARAAFIAGQQQAMARMQQVQGPSVTVNGEVRNHVIPWTADLTLAKAVIAADYCGATDPGQLLIVHNGIATHVDPKQLLSGVDIPMHPGDIIQLVPPAAPSKR